ncbi:unnamed protein product [Mycena citricolor]|uniref:Wbp11/ELF5/Saf1 N-terminal domain-containing protein n=1 Tax=Mycena citricolor TaxID=2018698 RepID=A0AAD2JXP9_9AGAR|nr:unnamed protein product [Mycena citricolor]
MAKGKNLNPADAHRKALRKKELKKASLLNKAERSKTRDLAIVKKDTTDLAAEVERLEFATDPKDKARYKDAKAELDRIYAKKEEYLKEHPEHRRLVYKGKKDDSQPDVPVKLSTRNYFDKHGLPRHPERSVYYDPVMNPFGVAPPGMPYQERPPLPGEVYSDASEDEDDDDDVAMPDGPPPDDEESDDDDIPMPEGPPPNQSVLPMPAGPSPAYQVPPPPGFPPNMLPVRPPPPPPGFPGPPPMNFHPFPGHALPPPPPGFFPGAPMPIPLPPRASLPQKPIPMGSVPAAAASLPAKPVDAIASANLMAATVFAAPELRDFKKEATTFVPANVRKKTAAAASAAAAAGPASKINAAPTVAPTAAPSLPDNSVAEGSSSNSLPARPDLLSSLKGKFGLPPPPAKPVKPKDDYEKFVDSVSDILGPR